MLPHVIRFNANDKTARASYNELALIAKLGQGEEGVSFEALAGEIEKLLHAAKIPTRIKASPEEQKLIPMLAEEAAQQWTAKFNPRAVSQKNFEELYHHVFDARTSERKAVTH
jgi:alcohol dehydrogenase